jgi:hypothetical protein
MKVAAHVAGLRRELGCNVNWAGTTCVDETKSASVSCSLTVLVPGRRVKGCGRDDQRREDQRRSDDAHDAHHLRVALKAFRHGKCRRNRHE